MRKCYIGIGGLGTKLLKEFEESHSCGDMFVYIDAVPEDLAALGEGRRYALSNQKHGCYQRIVGKDEIKAIIYNGRMPDFIDDYFLAEQLELVFVTSTFGGFGSATVFEISDYYSLKIKNYRAWRGVTAAFPCKTIAFPLSCFPFLKDTPESVLTQFGVNEIEFINEFRAKEARKDKWYQEQSNCIPCVDLFVPRPCDSVPLHSVIGLSNEDLAKLDSKSAYYYSPTAKKEEAEVFISYSSENQEIADMLVKAAARNGISCWIASKSMEAGSYAKQIVQGIRAARVFVVIVSADAIASPHVKNELDIATGRIRDGLVIVPFKIDDADLDDECRYYLGRQEFYFGKVPPMEDRIDHLVEKIKAVLHC